MADRPSARTRVAASSHDDRTPLVGASQMLLGLPGEDYAQRYKSWQDELWDYTRNVGEYGGVMDWFASGISRMHLVAAVQRPGEQREPEILADGPAADQMHQLAAYAAGGETQYLYKWGRHLGVPGVGFFIAYDRDGMRQFDVKSAKQIRRSEKPFYDAQNRIIKTPKGEVIRGFDVEVAEGRWEQLPYESLVGRIYRPDDELDYEVSSWSRGALTTLREIDLLNRHVVATLLSRLVFNGILFIPSEVTFPVNPQFKDAPDPFIAELAAVAARGIKDPGSPLSALPLPLRVKSDMIEHFKHLVIATGVDPKINELRAAAIQRLAQQLPAPPSAMEGTQDSNHWNAWKDSEDNIKLYFGPTMEILCGGHTDIYLRPMLKAAGHPLETPDGGRIICWYDASDLINKPDNSENARDAREKIVISDESYLRQLGMDDDDLSTDEERRKQILTTLAIQGLPLPDSYYLLYPDDKPDPGVDQLGNPIPQPGLAAGGPSPNAGPSGGSANGRPAADQSTVKTRAPKAVPTPSGPRGG